MNPTIPFPIKSSLSCSATVPTKSTSSWTARPDPTCSTSCPPRSMPSPIMANSGSRHCRELLRRSSTPAARTTSEAPDVARHLHQVPQPSGFHSHDRGGCRVPPDKKHERNTMYDENNEPLRHCRPSWALASVMRAASSTGRRPASSGAVCRRRREGVLHWIHVGVYCELPCLSRLPEVLLTLLDSIATSPFGHVHVEPPLHAPAPENALRLSLLDCASPALQRCIEILSERKA